VPSKLAAAPPERSSGRSPAPRAVRPPPAAPESRLVARLLLRPDLAARVPDDALEGSRPGAAVLREVVAFCRAHPHVTLGQVSAHFEGSEHAGPIEEALSEPLLATSHELDLEAEVDHWVAELREEKLARRRGELVLLLQAGTATPEQLAEYKALYARLEAARSGNPPTEARSKL